jgi:hypothetical protein
LEFFIVVLEALFPHRRGKKQMKLRISPVICVALFLSALLLVNSVSGQDEDDERNGPSDDEPVAASANVAAQPKVNNINENQKEAGTSKNSKKNNANAEKAKDAEPKEPKLAEPKPKDIKLIDIKPKDTKLTETDTKSKDTGSQKPAIQPESGKDRPGPATKLFYSKECQDDITRHCPRAKNTVLTDMAVLQCIHNEVADLNLIDKPCHNVTVK